MVDDDGVVPDPAQGEVADLFQRPAPIRSGRPWTVEECAALDQLHVELRRDYTAIGARLRQRFGAGRAYTMYSIEKQLSRMRRRSGEGVVVRKVAKKVTAVAAAPPASDADDVSSDCLLLIETSDSDDGEADDWDYRPSGGMWSGSLRRRSRRKSQSVSATVDICFIVLNMLRQQILHATKFEEIDNILAIETGNLQLKQIQERFVELRKHMTGKSIQVGNSAGSMHTANP